MFIYFDRNFYFPRLHNPDDLKKTIKFYKNYLGEIVIQSNTVSEMDKYIANEISKKQFFHLREDSKKQFQL